MPKTVVKQDPEAPVPVEVLAAEIAAISEGVRKMLAGRLNSKAIVVLLNASTGVGKSTIKAVLDGLSDLESDYLRKK